MDSGSDSHDIEQLARKQIAGKSATSVNKAPPPWGAETNEELFSSQLRNW
jgi:hypothetical protein